jgi:hypothetical protein
MITGANQALPQNQLNWAARQQSRKPFPIHNFSRRTKRPSFHNLIGPDRGSHNVREKCMQLKGKCTGKVYTNQRIEKARTAYYSNNHKWTLRR